MCTSTWNDLTDHAHALITRPSRRDLTPAVTLMQSLHTQLPATPAAVCAHLDPGSPALSLLARYAQSGDPNALLMAAVLMRHSLRRISEWADPDGYRSTDQATRINETLSIFFTIIRTTAETQLLTPRYLYWQTLKRVTAGRPHTTVAAPLRVDPGHQILDAVDTGRDEPAKAAAILDHARANRVITTLEYETLKALYIAADSYNLLTTAAALGARAGAVERRAQRAIRKLITYHSKAAA